MDFKDFKNKTWIDWVKVLVAIDIAFSGFGLILDQNINILSHIFGFITRIPFGILYIFVAVLILKKVFPSALHIDPKDEMNMEGIDGDIEQGVVKSKNLFSTALKKINSFFDKLIVWVDGIFDRIADFFNQRHSEIKKEVTTILQDDNQKKPPQKDTKKTSQGS